MLTRTIAVVGDDRRQAERLVGCDLLMDKELLEEEDVPFELSDMRGYAVLDVRTGEKGELLHVDNYSGNVVFTISLLGKEILLPYSEDYVLEILPEEQFLRVDIPEDIFDLY